MSEFNSNFVGGFSPWANGIPPCFVSQPTYANQNAGYQNWNQNARGNARGTRGARSNNRRGATNQNNNRNNKRPQQQGAPAGSFKRLKTDSQSVQLKVTIPGEGRGERTVNSRGRAANGRGRVNRGGASTVPLPRKKPNVPYVCFVCNRYFSVEASFKNHLVSENHLAKEKLKLRVHATQGRHQQQPQPNSSRPNTVESPGRSVGKKKKGHPASPAHVNNQRKNVVKNQARTEAPGSAPNQIQRSHFCRDCNVNFTCSIIDHRRTPEHKNVKSMARPFCAECEMFFQTPQKFVKHCKNKKHAVWSTWRTPRPAPGTGVKAKKRKAAAAAAALRAKIARGDADDDEAEMGNYVTVDAVGIYEEGDEDDDGPPGVFDDVSIVDEAYGDDDDDAYVTADDATLLHENYLDQTNDEESDSVVIASGGSRISAAAKARVAKSASQPATSTPVASKNRTDAPSKAPVVDSKVQRAPSSIPETAGAQSTIPPVGVNFVVPISGFYCKICHKLFMEEAVAKTSHCQSEGHYSRFKAFQSVIESEAASQVADTTTKESTTCQAAKVDDAPSTANQAAPEVETVPEAAETEDAPKKDAVSEKAVPLPEVATKMETSVESQDAPKETVLESKADIPADPLATKVVASVKCETEVTGIEINDAAPAAPNDREGESTPEEVESALKDEYVPKITLAVIEETGSATPADEASSAVSLNVGTDSTDKKDVD